METVLKEKLIFLANKYETKDFIEKDPSKFMHQTSKKEEAELRGFVAASLAFGRRDQILKHIQMIIDDAEPSLYEWIINEKYKKFFSGKSSSFYRMYTHDSMILFFDSIKNILRELLFEGKKSLGDYFEKKYLEAKNLIRNNQWNGNFSFTGAPLLQDLIINEFPKECNLIPHCNDGACKKINMFIRWMVRSNSAVDLGYWSWYPKQDLLMPLDTHVMQQSVEFCLLKPSSTGKVPQASLKTARMLTDELREAFGDDPVRGDFALFGLGVNS